MLGQPAPPLIELGPDYRGLTVNAAVGRVAIYRDATLTEPVLRLEPPDSGFRFRQEDGIVIVTAGMTGVRLKSTERSVTLALPNNTSAGALSLEPGEGSITISPQKPGRPTLTRNLDREHIEIDTITAEVASHDGSVTIRNAKVGVADIKTLKGRVAVRDSVIEEMRI